VGATAALDGYALVGASRQLSMGQVGPSILDLLPKISRIHDGILDFVPNVAGMHDIEQTGRQSRAGRVLL
jgi:hypothetical protein